jgi:HD superfamily phosphodiesterase
MTPLLEEAFAEAAKLPQQEQDALAAVIFDELASERRWDHAFATTAVAEKMAAL